MCGLFYTDLFLLKIIQYLDIISLVDIRVQRTEREVQSRIVTHLELKERSREIELESKEGQDKNVVGDRDFLMLANIMALS